MTRDEALFSAQATAMAALRLSEDLARFLAGCDPEGFKRFVDDIAESAETTLQSRPPDAGAPLGRTALFREITAARLRVLRAAFDAAKG